MPGITLQTDAFILAKRPPSESFQSCAAFSAVDGSLAILHRVPKKPSPNHSPLDLFDKASLQLESTNQGRTWFVREARVLRRFEGIGRDYEALQHACALARLVARNPVAEESRLDIADLLDTALEAFASQPRPDVTHFKAMYCFARNEGYPVKQHWLASLPTANRANVATLLNQPLSRQTLPKPEVEGLRTRLAEYLRGHAEFLID